MSVKISEEDQKGLSPEEVAALGETTDEETLSDDELDELERLAGDDETDEGDKDDETPPDDGTAQAQGQQQEAAKPNQDESGDLFVDEIPSFTFIPEYSGTVHDSLKADLSSIREEYETGDISLAEYEDKRDGLVKQSQQFERGEQLWSAQQQHFFKHNPDFSDTKNPIRFAALDAAVRKIASGDAAKALYDAKDPLAGSKILFAAKRQVEAEFGLKPSGSAKQEANTSDKKNGRTRKPDARMPDMQTLSGLPEADTDSVSGGSKYDYLDNLTGLKMEREVNRIMKTDPAGYEEYLRSQG